MSTSFLPSEEQREQDEFNRATKDGVPANLERCWFGMEAARLEAEERETQGNPNTASKVPKRKKKAEKKNKVTKYFKPVINSQGYSLKHCEYVHEYGDYLFKPRGYGERSLALGWGVFGTARVFCHSCLLRPCLTIEHSDQKADTFLDTMTRYFGKKYMKRLPVPRCIWEEIKKSNESDSLCEEEEFNEQKEDGEEQEVNDDEIGGVTMSLFDYGESSDENEF